MTQLIRKMVFSNPKFRVICRNNKFVPQEFLGIWKLGLYADISKEFNCTDHVSFHFEHEDIYEAELVIERRIKQLLPNKYVVRNYYGH